MIEFLRHSSVLDLLVFLAVIALTVILIPVVIWIAIAARKRTPLYLALIVGVLPLLLALIGTYLKYKSMEMALVNNSDVSAEVVTAARQEAWIITYLGAAGTALIELIAVTGLILKKDRTV